MLDFPNPQMIAHFVGIGGIGMSGIAELLHHLGCKVQGSDIAENANVRRLREKNIPVMIGHDAAYVKDIGVLVVSSAVGPDNPEIFAARAAHVPVIQRAEMLAELMRLKKAVAIGGTHGKTTTTSMVAAMFEAAGCDPTVINGGIINSTGSNTRIGTGEWLVAEADESDGSFVKLPAHIALITNIDPEHMEHYGDMENLRATFLRFVTNIPFYGFAVLCADHAETSQLMSQIIDRRVVSCGLNPQAMVRGVNPHSLPDGMRFDVIARGVGQDNESIELPEMFLPMYGEHNVQNALAAIAVGLECGFSPEVIRDSLQNFSGVKRRFTQTGTVGEVRIIDDYAHHPVEIRAVLKAARAICQGQLIAVVQPHRYSRLRDLFGDFQTGFHDADVVLIADVYPAGEQPIAGIDKHALVEAVRASGHRHVVGIDAPEAIADKICEILNHDAARADMVIFMGAGSVTQWAYRLPETLRQRLKG